jgi:hypothetical protein
VFDATLDTRVTSVVTVRGRSIRAL